MNGFDGRKPVHFLDEPIFVSRNQGREQLRHFNLPLGPKQTAARRQPQ
jgi:hypothetical protein